MAVAKNRIPAHKKEQNKQFSIKWKQMKIMIPEKFLSIVAVINEQNENAFEI